MKPIAVLLCAGKGSRMGDTKTHKVCYELAGVPVVKRQMANLRKAGIDRFVVVVGHMSDKVMEILSDEDGIVYAYQARQDGTGGATMCALKTVLSMNTKAPVLITMGDKIIDPEVISGLCDAYEKSDKGVAFAVCPKEFNKSGGRIVEKDGSVYGIYEFADSCLLALGEKKAFDTEAQISVLSNLGVSEKKQNLILQRVKDLDGKIPEYTTLCKENFKHSEIESGSFVNTATYLTDPELLMDALSNTGTDNAQGEIYLTDAINDIIESKGGCIYPVMEKEKILTYSTLEELLMLAKYFIPAKKTPDLPMASELLAKVKQRDKKLHDTFVEIYGDNEEFLESRYDMYEKLISAFIERYGDKKIIVTRSPGRVNLLGRHIEHRGGSINVMTINRETLCAASPREDETVTISNTDKEHFKDYSFSVPEVLGLCDSDDWVSFIESDAISDMVVHSKGEWVNYVKAGILRLQLKNKDSLLCGMDMMFTGDIPMAAGLSSSSSIVVATNEALVALNGIDMQIKEFIHLCGEGEWFVGSRGGAGDHAAMKCSDKGKITHISFCPFDIGDSCEFSSEYSIVVANSFVEANKSSGAKDMFNEKIACYEFGFMLVKHMFPQYSEKLSYLKDINTKNLGVKPAEIYKIILALPEYISSKELKSIFTDKDDIKKIESIQKTHKVPEKYAIRSTMLYGISECARAELCIDLLKSGNYEKLGRMMNISHNGDRVYKNGKEFDNSVSDVYIYRLISDLRSEDPTRVTNAQICYQPGGYACSTKEIDDIVDSINSVEGVMGCELSGAGLGGCVIVLVKKKNTQQLLDFLKEKYYDPKGLPMGAQVFLPVAGSGIVNI